MQALIIGGGIAGCAAALALERVGWEPTIFEAYDRSAGLEQGVFLTVAVNGLAALDAVGAGDAVRSLGFPTAKVRMLSDTGRTLGVLDIGPTTERAEPTRTVRRADLYAALLEQVERRGITIERGRRLVGASHDVGSVVAAFEDGSTATGNVLIGADGLHSATRALIDPDAPAPRYTGLLNLGGFTPAGAVPVDRASGGDYRMMWGRRAFFGYSVAPDGEVWWFSNPPRKQPLTDAERRQAPEDVLEALAQLFDDDAGPAAAIVRASRVGGILNANGWDLPSVRHWSRDRMVLIGDAAHAVSPATGQGASLAIEDAVVLARHLAEQGTGPDAVPQAFVAYERERRQRVEKIVAYGKRLGSTKTAGPIGRRIRDLVLPRFLAMAASPKVAAKQAWIYDHSVSLPAPSPPAVPATSDPSGGGADGGA